MRLKLDFNLDRDALKTVASHHCLPIAIILRHNRNSQQNSMVHSDSSELTLTILGGSWVALLIWIRLGWSFPGLPTAMANWCICGGLGGQGYPHQPVSHVPPTVLASHRLLGLLL